VAITDAASAGHVVWCPRRKPIAIGPEQIIEAVPSVERVRLVNSGTEATMSGGSVSPRGATGRHKVQSNLPGIINGHVDSLLAPPAALRPTPRGTRIHSRR